ncbi:MAG: hypothetical protein V1760_02835 [Candidatus Peregrinibacteria bacterium]
MGPENESPGLDPTELTEVLNAVGLPETSAEELLALAREEAEEVLEGLPRAETLN